MKLHPFSAVRDALTLGLQGGAAGVFLGVAASGAELVPGWVIVALAPLGFLVGAAYGVARYAAFEYDLGATALHIGSGVVSRKERAIPLGRIQNVDVHQSFVGRLLGLAVVRFETAGGGETEATLRVVAREEAERLQTDIRRRKRAAAAGEAAPGDARASAASADQRAAGAADGRVATADEEAAAGGRAPSAEGERAADTGEGTPAGRAAGEGATGAAGEGAVDATGEGATSGAPGEGVAERAPGEGMAGETTAERAGRVPAAREPAGELLFELSFHDLLVLSGVSFRLQLLPVLVFAIPLADELLFRVGRRLLLDALGGGPAAPSVATLLSGAAALVGLLALAWLASAALTFVRYFGFRLERVEDGLVYERGLLSRYSGTIPLGKVQALSVRENVLMRRLGYAALAVETAGYSPGGDGSSGRTPSAIPLADRATLLELAGDLEGVTELSVERPPRRARRRYAGRFALVVLAATGLAWAVHRFAVPLGPFWALPLLALAAVPPAAHLRWVHRGHRAGADHALTRTGFWRRTTRIVPYYRIQTVVTERTVFQRRFDLASVVVDTAASGSLLSRDATAHDLDREDARALHAHLRGRLREALAERRAG